MRRPLYIILLFSSFSLFSQERKVTHTDQQWAQYYFQLLWNRKLNVVGDVGIRYRRSFNDLGNTLARIGLQYRLHKKVSVAAGGAYFSLYSNEKVSREEWRGWQELFIKQEIGRLSTNHRFRLEERFFHDLRSRQNTFNFRARYRFYFTLPLNNATMEDRTFYLLGGDEIFINFGGNTVNMYDQNRLLGGIGYKLNNSISFNLTYVYQYAQRGTNAYEIAEIYWFGITYQHGATFKKKEKQP